MTPPTSTPAPPSRNGNWHNWRVRLSDCGTVSCDTEHRAAAAAPTTDCRSVVECWSSPVGHQETPHSDTVVHRTRSPVPPEICILYNAFHTMFMMSLTHTVQPPRRTRYRSMVARKIRFDGDNFEFFPNIKQLWTISNHIEHSPLTAVLYYRSN